MSSSAVRQKLASKLLRALAQDKKTALTGPSKANVVYLDSLEFINKVILQVKKKYPAMLPKQQTIKFTAAQLSEARGIAKRYQDTFCKNKAFKGAAPSPANTKVGRHLMSFAPESWAKIEGGTAFIVTNFTKIAELKKEIIQLFFDKNSEVFKVISERVDRGHGGEGIATSIVQSGAGLGQMQDSVKKSNVDAEQLKKEFFEHIDQAVATADIDISQQASEIKSIYIDYEKVVTKSGKVRAVYIPVIEFQTKYDNRATDAPREKAMKQVVADFFKKIGTGELVSMEGSSSIEDQVYAHAVGAFTKKLRTKKNVKVKLNPKTDPNKVNPKSKGTSGRVKSSQKGKGSLNITAAKAASGFSKSPNRKKNSDSKQQSPIALMGIINSKLPQTVASNMGAPALENITGRFANSARVTDVTQTGKGYPSIGYTYEKQPYGVFENTSGSRFASLERDPRRLIDRSIREIAAELAIGRFYTRRV